jgi:hypothetical protein
MMRRRTDNRTRGQALVEFALTVPIAALVIFSVVVLGLYVFYQQQVTNVAREAARYAAIHSSTAACPTSSWREPQAPPSSYGGGLCDGVINPADPYPWPRMTEHARSYAWAVAPSLIHINACWSGYVPTGTTGYQADFPAVDPTTGTPNDFDQCTIDGVDPIADSASLDCRTRMTTAADDPASDIPGNQVTAYACFRWSPPLAGLLMIPSQITIRAVITEVIHRQQ